jgi:FixJ family two-component response regulator
VSTDPEHLQSPARRDAAAPVIYVVDDDASFRIAIGRLLQASGYRVALYESGERFLKDPPSPEPGCILLDVRMPGLNGLELQDRLSDLGAILPIVFLTGHGDLAMSVRAIKSGAEDFLPKPVSKEALLAVVERALVRYGKSREEHDRLDALRSLVATLTPRESDVFAQMVRGKLTKQIAFELGISERTIKAHRQAVMQKLNARSLAEAVSLAERVGILSGDETR